jgi:two-component system cell cycle sensor histidine kinase/response regulator CckA
MLTSVALFPSLEPAAAASPPLRDGAVLLVEDEDSLAELLTHLLARLKIRVLRAADGAQAVRLFRENQAAISMAFVDCTLPDMAGGDLCHEFRAAAPGLPLLLTSGRDHRALERALASGGPCQFLPKPYMPAEVMSRVKSLLTPSA